MTSPPHTPPDPSAGPSSPPAAATAAADVPARKRPLWQRLLRDLLIVALIFGVVNWVQTRSVPDGPAPAFEARLATGQSIALHDWLATHPGQAVGVYFWAEWCPICKAQESTITRLREDWPVLTVAMQSGDAPAVRAHLAQRTLDWPAVVDFDGALTRSFGLNAVPGFVIIAPDGTIRSASVGLSSSWGLRLRLWWAETM